MRAPRPRSPRIARTLATLAAVVLAGAALAGLLHEGAAPAQMNAAATARSPDGDEAADRRAGDRLAPNLPWRLNTPHPWVVPDARANPVAVADKLAARAVSMDARARLRAFEGAPPLIPHSIRDLNVQTCRACHAQGLRTGDKVARMVSHTYLPNCTQCHVEAEGFLFDANAVPANAFEGLRGAGLGGTRAWAGAPPVMPHAIFMRTNCISCHGEFGYDGWRPDHLSRSNCAQCHAPAAQFEQLSPTFGVADIVEGLVPTDPR